MSSCVPWDFEDEQGDNPTGQPGCFSFDVWYEIIHEPGCRYDANGDGEPGYGPVVEVVGVTCRYVDIDGDGYRQPSNDEEKKFSEWFQTYLDAHPDEHARIESAALQYMHVGPDDDAPNW